MFGPTGRRFFRMRRIPPWAGGCGCHLVEGRGGAEHDDDDDGDDGDWLGMMMGC